MSQQGGRFLNPKQIASGLKIEDAGEKQILQVILDELVADKKLKKEDYGKYAYEIAGSDEFTGKVETTRRGAGYISCDSFEEDIFIHAKNLNHALNGDTVKFILKQRKGEKPEGKITQVVSRGKETIVGRLSMSGKFGFVIADNQKMYVDVFIPATNLNGAKDGDDTFISLGKRYYIVNGNAVRY